nr:MAG TPA: hypothetical protein [Caudoviricetes sp.]DAJ94854.1 MAG TPA: hypothetical protein [Caudoviricetes sp.]
MYHISRNYTTSCVPPFRSKAIFCSSSARMRSISASISSFCFGVRSR